MTTDVQTPDVDRVTEKSESVLRAARRIFAQRVGPCSSTGPSAHAVTAVTTPLVFAKAKGATVTDIDGNDYIDFALDRGTNILGHADERVVAAISKAASKGLGFSSPSQSQVRLAEMIVGRFPSIDTVFLTHSHARAVASAIRVARAETGRCGVAVVRGSVAEIIARTPDLGSAMTGASSYPASADRDVPDHTFVAERNAPPLLKEIVEANGPSIAAVVVEPFSVSTGVCPPPDGHLAALRATCDLYGALLVFDDSVIGLRVGPNGAEGATGVTPDLTCIGSELSSGLPLAALGGNRDVMRNVDSTAGLNTTCDAPIDDLAVAAGIVVLQALAEPESYDALNTLASRLAQGINAALLSAGRRGEAYPLAGLVGVGHPAADEAGETSNMPVTQTAAFFDSLLRKGIMPPLGVSVPWAVSAAHGHGEIDRAVEAFGATLDSTRS